MDKRQAQVQEMSKVVYKVQPLGGLELTVAARIYDAGYRKQSEVAREIFEEIEKKIGRRLFIDDHMRTYANDSSVSYNALAELKEKYVKEDE